MLQGCYRTIRLQNFKDIHNKFRASTNVTRVVIELLDYKISKTYTTDAKFERLLPWLLQNYQITKFQRHTQLIGGDIENQQGCYRTIRLQNFKDIHNMLCFGISFWVVVIELLDYKNSKTYTTQQRQQMIEQKLLQNYQITKFQRHTQRNLFVPYSREGCYRTIRLQNFKDIHNYIPACVRRARVVIELLDYKISKTRGSISKRCCKGTTFF